MWDAFSTEYLPETPRMRLRSHELHTSTNDGHGRTRLSAQIDVDGSAVTLTGEGDGPVEALVTALRHHWEGEFDVLDYTEHAIGRGADAQAVAYVESASGTSTRWGIGTDPNITTASLRAVLSAFERQHFAGD